MKKTRIWAMLIIGMFCFVMAVSAYGEGAISVESIVLDQYEVVLNNGQKTKVVATVSPGDAKNQKVKWTSSNNKVAQVSGNGDITAKGPGTAVITCDAADGNGAKAEVNVTVNQLVSGLQVKGNKLTVPLKATVDAPEVIVKPDNATNKVLSWTSSDETICTVVADGSITAVGAGDCIVTVATTDGSEKTATVSVHVPVFENAEVDVTIDQYEGQLIPIDFHGFSVENITHKASSSKSFLYYLDEEGLFVYPIAKGGGTITLTNKVNKSDVVKYNIDIAESAVYENDDGPLSAFIANERVNATPVKSGKITYYVKGGQKPYTTINVTANQRNFEYRFSDGGQYFGGLKNPGTLVCDLYGDINDADILVVDASGETYKVRSNEVKGEHLRAKFEYDYCAIPGGKQFEVNYKLIGGSGEYTVEPIWINQAGDVTYESRGDKIKSKAEGTLVYDVPEKIDSLCLLFNASDHKYSSLGMDVPTIAVTRNRMIRASFDRETVRAGETIKAIIEMENATKAIAVWEEVKYGYDENEPSNSEKKVITVQTKKQTITNDKSEFEITPLESGSVLYFTIAESEDARYTSFIKVE